MRAPRYGFSVIELLVALAVMGALVGIGATLFPRNGLAVSQAQRIFASSVQFARFEAIKRNVSVEVLFSVGDTAVEVRERGGATLRRFVLDPQGERVVVKSATPSAAMEFNSRGVAVSPISRSVVVGIIGNDANNRTLMVSGQGSVTRGS